ncbi:isochorismatase family protein [Paenibacillus sacheonensis]|uniref:Isochorismatase family protein n=1 Tax=Paenibacillus sacheonensis TaxID=742054 RepID=A0A7X4YJV6_9BACL|nr:isochorismatase family protein [Paenibacillus sacheonensis]MBM7563905.1 nicotinamidase-related amidase [Paenibacillus sacheonensis]NBC67748.1 isochorismatase family protein [Paenibacillus sacheonensis]
MEALNIDFSKTALVLIDLQKGIIGRAPAAAEIISNGVRLVEQFRANGGFISFVKVDFVDGKDALRPVTDQSAQAGGYPEGWSEFVPELGVGPRDHVVVKRQWSAFIGTDLDVQLRRRGIDTIVLCGISTNIGVESTARDAFQLGYNQIFITDAMVALSQEEHDATCKYIFPRIGKLRTTAAFVDSVSGK